MISARVVRFGAADAAKGIDLSNEEALRERRARMERGEEVDDGGEERVPVRRADPGPDLDASVCPRAASEFGARGHGAFRSRRSLRSEGTRRGRLRPSRPWRAGDMSPQQPTVETGATDVSITLTPNARILGQVVDEDAESADSGVHRRALGFRGRGARLSDGPQGLRAASVVGRPLRVLLDVRQGTWWSARRSPGLRGRPQRVGDDLPRRTPRERPDPSLEGRDRDRTRRRFAGKPSSTRPSKRNRRATAACRATRSRTFCSSRCAVK
jgi:hypothetical protein